MSNVDKKSEEGQQPVRLCNYIDVYRNERITEDMDFMAATATPQQAKRFALRAGDVLVTKDSEAWDDIAVSACVESAMPDVLCGYHLALVRPVAGVARGRFLARAISAAGLREQFWVEANGITRFGLGADSISGAWLPVPPVTEQDTIADFLDRETAKIDALVEKKERLIGLLQEKRTALITHAVTKGLDPNVPMKESGIRWLGQIPAHWACMRVKSVATMQAGLGITSEAIEETGDYPVYGGNGLRGYTTAFTHTGSVVLVGRQGALCGNVNYASGQFWASEHAVVVEPVEGIDVRWLGETLRAMKLNDFSVAAAQPGLAVDRILALGIAVPPEHEQQAIARYLDRETAKIDVLIAKVQEAIERLKEYRTALISTAVTGKIDVRGV